MREEQIQEAPVKVLLVGVDVGEEPDFERSMEELASLAEAAEKEVAGQIVQRLDHVNKALYIGTGKVTEVRRLAEECGAQEIVFDNSLTPSQVRNLGNELELPIIDRTNLILDIFAIRAQTREAKLQVETARLQYMLPRLVGMYDALSRQGGASGSMSNKGTGEKKLELDRRKIEHRITELKKELEDVGRTREVQRKKRQQSRIPQVALVGYTNAGKSTLLNTLTDAGVLSEDKLFATLDPTTRLLELDGGQRIYLTDTVGFIRKLPHHLIEAFKSTLEEAKYADVILHVVDASNPQVEEQMFIVYETLRELGVKDKTIVTLFNKQDRLAGNEILRDFKADYVLKISARTGLGLDELKNTLEKILIGNQIYIERVVEYKDAGMLQLVRKYGQLIEEKYTENGIEIKARVPKDIYGRLGE